MVMQRRKRGGHCRATAAPTGGHLYSRLFHRNLKYFRVNKMSWTYATLLALLTVLLALSWSPQANSAAVPSSTGSAKDPQGPLKRVFMKQADASNFFRTRTRRGVKSQDELDAEQRQILAADERKREFHEEKRNEFESYSEEDNDEQNERTRESTEQWREFHYDGMHPAYEYNRHST